MLLELVFAQIIIEISEGRRKLVLAAAPQGVGPNFKRSAFLHGYTIIWLGDRQVARLQGVDLLKNCWVQVLAATLGLHFGLIEPKSIVKSKLLL